MLDYTKKLNKNKKIKTAVLGATGVVGQVFLSMLANNDLFDLRIVTASDSKKEKAYADAVQWVLPTPIPGSIKHLKIDSLDISKLKSTDVKIIFSALPAYTAKIIEPQLREQNFYIFSNASALRYEENVPILIPEINPEALELIENQGFPEKGFVVTNANCSTTGLVIALAPLTKFDIKEVFVSTYQSVSGAGYPGLPALDIVGNVLPYIKNEEEKMVKEVQKILQQKIALYPQCIRIPVLFGHLETVWLSLGKTAKKEDIINTWNTFKSESHVLPTLPETSIIYSDEADFPQPKMAFWGTPPGMQVFIGRLRESNGKIGFTLLVNNLVKGAAGGSIANAELFLKKYGGNL